MTESSTYENFPLRIVFISNALSLSIYGLGFLIMIRLGWILSILYLIYILILEIKLIRNDCINCFYWGKTCGFGKGRISSWFFQKGDPSKFCSHEISWKNMIPDILISLIPLITGIILIIIDYDFAILIFLIALVLLSTEGNEFIRGSLTCKHCKKRELGCPAYELFNKNRP
jgi:hypothetical protein